MKFVEAVRTKGGTLVAAPVITPADHDTIVPVACAWCNYLQEELDEQPSLYTSVCGNCQGTGVSGTQTRAQAILQAWEDRVFFIEAEAAHRASYDMDDYWEDQAHGFGPQAEWFVDAITGRDVLVIPA